MGALRICLGALLIGACSWAAGAEPSQEADFTAEFGSFEGCALLVTRDRYGEKRIEFRPDECRIPRSPCSTFKIPNALVGLASGAVSGPGDRKAWDGTVREREITNRDHTLASAMTHSVVWYFQRMARDIGAETMQAWLDRLDYGNRDMSSGIERFWLGGSLEIDGFRQLAFIEALWRSGLPFPPAHQAQVREMLRQDADLEGILHGKTGSCLGAPRPGTPDHGWFIGWVDWTRRNAAGPSTSWFVIGLVGSGARGSRAREIAISLLRKQQP